MPTSGDQLKVSFGALDTAATDTETIANQIDQQLEDLKTYLAPLIASWSGDASTSYQALQSKWDTSAADLNQILRQITTTLRTSNENYGGTEKSNTTIFEP
jgi:6 kDa early secretory antigenic target